MCCRQDSNLRAMALSTELRQRPIQLWSRALPALGLDGQHMGRVRPTLRPNYAVDETTIREGEGSRN